MERVRHWTCSSRGSADWPHTKDDSLAMVFHDGWCCARFSGAVVIRMFAFQGKAIAGSECEMIGALFVESRDNQIPES